MGLFITLLSFVLLTITSVITSNPKILNDLRSRADVGINSRTGTANTNSGSSASWSSWSSRSTPAAPVVQPAPKPSTSKPTSQSTPAPPAPKPATTSIRVANDDETSSPAVGGRGSYPGGTNPGGPTTTPKPTTQPKPTAPATSIRIANDDEQKPKTTTPKPTPMTDAQEIAELKKEWLKTRGVDGAMSITPKVTNSTAVIPTNTPPIPTPVIKAGGIGDKPRNLNYMKDDYVDPETGVKPNSKETCGDSEGFVSGTYCSGGSRHIVAIESTQKAYNEYIKANSNTILNITDDQLLSKAKTDFGVSCQPSDYACQKTAIAKAQAKLLDEMIVVGKTTRDALTATRIAIQATNDFSDISKPLDAFIAKYGSAGSMTEEKDLKTANEILTKIFTDAGFKTDEIAKMVADRQILADYVNPNISDYEFAKRNGCDSACQQYGGAASREAWLKAKTGYPPEKIDAYTEYYIASGIKTAINPLLTSQKLDADVINDSCKNNQTCKEALNKVLLFTSNKPDSQVISEFCKQDTSCLSSTKNREDILKDYSKYLTTEDAKLISQSYIDNRTKLVTDALSSYASIKSDNQLAKEKCGNNFGCIDRFTRDSTLAYLNPAEKASVQMAYEQTVAKLAQLIPQVINNDNKKIVDSGKTIQIGGLTIDKSTYEHISDINSKIDRKSVV